MTDARYLADANTVLRQALVEANETIQRLRARLKPLEDLQTDLRIAHQVTQHAEQTAEDMRREKCAYFDALTKMTTDFHTARESLKEEKRIVVKMTEELILTQLLVDGLVEGRVRSTERPDEPGVFDLEYEEVLLDTVPAETPALERHRHAQDEG